MLDYFFCHSNISQEHKLFNHIVSTYMFVLTYIGWILGLMIKLELNLW